MVISCPALEVGGTYTVSALSQSQSVTFSSVIWGAGSGTGGMTPPGGFGGGPGDQSGRPGGGRRP